MALIEVELGGARPFNYDLTSNSSMIKSIANHLFDEFELDNKKKQQKIDFLVCLLVNLKRGWEMKDYLMISRDRSNFSKPARYKRNIQNYRTVIPILDKMIEHKYIKHVKGYKGLKGARSFTSKILATGGLKLLLKNNVTMSEIIEQRPTEFIVLRDENKKDKDYRENQVVKNRRKSVIIYNDVRDKIEVSIQKTPEDLYGHYKADISGFRITNKISINKGVVDKIILRSGNLVRIFNEKFNRGGRFYRGVESVMPKAVRKYFYFDDEETVELDYSGLHLRMAYNHSGKKYTEDPYSIETGNEGLRDIYKIVSLIMINSRSEEKAIRAIRKELMNYNFKRYIPDLKDKTIKELMKIFSDKHQDIKDIFFSGIGIIFQNFDSQIANSILMHFAYKKELVMCVHDSFIVKKRFEKELKDEMIKRYQGVFPGFIPIVK